MTPKYIELANLFRVSARHECTLRGGKFQRWRLSAGEEVEAVADLFPDSGALCSFLRFNPAITDALEVAVAGAYSLATTPAGGWLLRPADATHDLYWVPQPPMVRRLDAQGHVLSGTPALTVGVDVSTAGMAITLQAAAGQVLDLVVWRIPATDTDLVAAFGELATLERQPYFLWSSHTAYARPSDLYLHLIHGHVYENHEVWPHYWRICSELDAYALYLVLSGLERATGKRLYALLKRQVVYSVIARQAADGGWDHGEWTDRMESHYRLRNGGTLMLADFLEEADDATIRTALERAVACSVGTTDRLDHGTWFLHDSLEQNADSARKYPFRWAPSRAFGKSPTNMLILNTHLDTSIALERYTRVTSNREHEELIASAQAATHAILASRPAEWLYRPLFRAIGLTMLPTSVARALPLPLRAVKRIAWKYLIPLLPRVKARFPRIVMPGGFVDRALAQAGLSYRYLPVNLMDLMRARRIFDDQRLEAVLETSFAFTQHGGIRPRWKELRGKEDDALGFWCEALYHLCLAREDKQFRAWLAEAMIDLSDNGLGLPPSLLGANREAIPDDQQMPCLNPLDERLRIANLSQRGEMEFVVVNPSGEDVPIAWRDAPRAMLAWSSTAGADCGAIVPARSWLRGRSSAGSPAAGITRVTATTHTSSGGISRSESGSSLNVSR